MQAVLLTKDQALNKPYYIAVYADNGDGEPWNSLYETCVVPMLPNVAMDCTNRRVLGFRAPVSFPVVAGEHYWLQILENDSNSVRSGAADFAWSGRQPARICDAVQADAQGVVHGPLIDVCNDQIDDPSSEIFVLTN